jgi:lipoprotein-anchoring transpeptidase ErfK/SrfK
VFKSSVLQPSITATDLKPSQEKVNSILAQKVTFNIAGHEIAPSKSDIAGWIELSPVSKEKTVDVNVDSGKVLQYINKIARPYVQPPRSRLITNTDSGQVVLDAGANGIDVVQKDQTAADVAKKLVDGKGLKTDLSIKYAASQTVEVQPYAKWFVADVTTKRMYAYEGTTLVRSFLVSAGAPRTPTVLGKYAIYTKYKSQDMSGNNADGSRYFQPAVPYVNYFYGGYAIHGNYWRPDSWFGNINSSHGCIGVTVSDGAWIYNWAAVGTPVIIHK